MFFSNSVNTWANGQTRSGENRRRSRKTKENNKRQRKQEKKEKKSKQKRIEEENENGRDFDSDGVVGTWEKTHVAKEEKRQENKICACQKRQGGNKILPYDHGLHRVNYETNLQHYHRL